MDNSFFAYLERLEMMAFFSGYLLIYLFFSYVGEILNKRGLIKLKIVF